MLHIGRCTLAVTMDLTERKITKIAREASKLAVRTLKEDGIGTAEYDFIHLVRHHPGITQAEVREQLRVDKGAAARKACANACIGCGKCAKECPFEAITVTNNVAYIDYTKCRLCRKCVAVCPTGAIHELNFPPRKEAAPAPKAETVKPAPKAEATVKPEATPKATSEEKTNLN